MVDGFEELKKNSTQATLTEENKQEIRPLTFDDYIGQEEIKRQLKIFIKAAKMRDKPLSHILLYGAPGLGKTTLASIIAKELGVNIHYASGASIEKPSDLATLLVQAEKNDIIFIDEIHALKLQTEEFLHPAMEDFVLDLSIQNGDNTKQVRIPLSPFTLIGATTKPGSLSKPFRDRFKNQQQLQYYTINELIQILKRTAKILRIEASEDSLMTIAKRSRQIARIANNLLSTCGDFAIAENDSKLTLDVTMDALSSLAIDESGLNQIDRQLLFALADNFDNQPTGLKNLASTLQENVDTLETVIEPFLLQSGFLKRTSRGRQLTAQGLAYVEASKKNN